MKLVVGLGNPGPRYETTRHNAGFLAVDSLVDRWRAQGPVTKFQGEVYQAEHKGEKVIIAKPQTFMNVSGACVAELFNFYKCRPEDLIVIYDELDLPPLTLRLKTGGGAGGHNGIKSIDSRLGDANNKYHRVRIGIGKPTRPSQGDGADYVLAPFTDDELVKLNEILDPIGAAVELLIEGKAAEAMNRYNRKEEA
ncbi:MAG: aminoacyl-tRNA hydrolase [Bacteriovoracia bacterium]